MNNSIGDRLKLLRASLGGGNQTQFAEKLGITQTSLSKYENGTVDIPDGVKIKIGGFGINLHWLITGTGEMFLSSVPQGDGKHPLISGLDFFIDQKLEKLELRMAELENSLGKSGLSVPKDPDSGMFVSEPESEYAIDYEKALFVENVAAGWPIYQSEDHSVYIDVPKQLIKTRPEDYYVARVKGTSMTAAGIPDGCLALFRISDTPRDGAIQIVERQGEATVKRMREIPGKGWKICFEDYTRRFIEIDPGDEFHIQGDFIAVLPEDE
jgi:SOS-response transcriptional repressor LexA/DNA-binding XRE family transcriptional regulator